MRDWRTYANFSRLSVFQTVPEFWDTIRLVGALV